MENGDHITRREVGLIVETVRQEARTLEQRLTVRFVVAVVGANALTTLVDPVAAAAFGASAYAGYKLATILLLRW